MKQPITCPTSSKGSSAVWIFAALTMLALSIWSVPAVINELKTGRVYSLAVFIGDGTKISKSDSPAEFWLNTGLHITGFVLMAGLSVLLLCLLFMEHKRKVTAATKERVRHDA
jgi:hypothetical protein